MKKVYLIILLLALPILFLLLSKNVAEKKFERLVINITYSSCYDVPLSIIKEKLSQNPTIIKMDRKYIITFYILSYEKINKIDYNYTIQNVPFEGKALKITTIEYPAVSDRYLKCLRKYRIIVQNIPKNVSEIIIVPFRMWNSTLYWSGKEIYVVVE